MENEKKRGNWGTNFGFLMAAVGSAVGLGNIWGFPYKMGANGGFAFLLVYLVLVICVGFIVMLGELTLGRKTGKGAVGTYIALSKGFKWVGWFGVLSAFLIMSFYSVLGGYCIKYTIVNFGDLIGAGFGSAGMAGGDIFSSLITNPTTSIVFTLIFMVISCVIVMGGISGGIEKFSKVAMPALFVMLLIIIIRSVTLPGAGAGLEFMFKPDFTFLKENFIKVLSTAGGQMFFSLSLGMGCMITYGSYLNKTENLERNSLFIVLSDTLIAIMAGLAVIPAAFALGGDGAAMAGPSLLFVTMQNVFASMNLFGISAFGSVFGIIFYLLVIIAAITSAISLIEVITTFFMDAAEAKGKQGNRKVITIIASLVIMILATVVAADGLGSNGMWVPGQVLAEGNDLTGQTVFSSIINGSWKYTATWNDCWLDFMDTWSEGIMMPLGALFMSLFIGYELGIKKFGEEITASGHKFTTKWFFAVCCCVIVPIAMVMVLIGQIESFFGVQILSKIFVF